MAIRRIGTPRYQTPQPDRDFPQGSRPQDTLNRALPSQMGNQNAGSMFKPRQGSVRKVAPRPQPQQTQTANQVRFNVSGDPNAIAQMLTNMRMEPPVGQYPQTTIPSVKDPLAPPLMGGGTQPQPQPEVPGQPETPSPEQPPGTEQPPAGTPPPQEAPAPLPTEFQTLQDYINAVGGLDFINEESYAPYAGWTPQDPGMLQAKTALDAQLQNQLMQATGNQETAKAMQKLILSRMIEDELEDQEFNKEAMAERGIFSSGITKSNSRDIFKGYMRSAGDNFFNLASELMGNAGGLTNFYGNDYLNQILQLASQEAALLAQQPGAGGNGGTGGAFGATSGNADPGRGNQWMPAGHETTYPLYQPTGPRGRPRKRR